MLDGNSEGGGWTSIPNPCPFPRDWQMFPLMMYPMFSLFSSKLPPLSESIDMCSLRILNLCSLVLVIKISLPAYLSSFLTLYLLNSSSKTFQAQSCEPPLCKICSTTLRHVQRTNSKLKSIFLGTTRPSWYASLNDWLVSDRSSLELYPSQISVQS